MQDCITLDIESIPAQRPDVLEEIRATIKPPGNIKKAETIAAWMEAEAPAAIDEAYRKTGLDGAYGQICVIGFAVDDAGPQTVWAPDWQNPNSERELLEDFYIALGDMISPSAERSIMLVGHNVVSFDLRFMVQRSIVKGIRPHGVIARAAQAKPWETDKVFDTMVQWAGAGNRISLDKLCKALGIESPKGDITGATVWDAVKAGRIEEVVEYCAGDVIATREVHRRLTFSPIKSAAVELEDWLA